MFLKDTDLKKDDKSDKPDKQDKTDTQDDTDKDKQEGGGAEGDEEGKSKCNTNPYLQSVNFGPFRQYQNKLTEKPEIVRFPLFTVKQFESEIFVLRVHINEDVFVKKIPLKIKLHKYRQKLRILLISVFEMYFIWHRNRCVMCV